MDTRTYIDSGILELYVMDALTAEEMAEVERRALSDPAIAMEIEAIREALLSLDLAEERAPRPELRATILDAIGRDGAPSAERADPPSRPGNVIALPAAPARSSRTLLAASWILVALSIGAATYFGTKWQSAEAEADDLRRENQRLASENTAITERATQVERSLDIMRSAEFHAVPLAGTEHAPNAHPVVYWNPSSREVHMVAKNLPEPPAGKQYQLWAIRGEERIDAGVFETDRARQRPQRLKDVDAADAFAVTLEPAGGSPAPTLEAIVAVGKL